MDTINVVRIWPQAARIVQEEDDILEVQFASAYRELYVWRPKWEDIRELLRVAAQVEYDNSKGQSPELEKFRDACMEVITSITAKKEEAGKKWSHG